MPLGSIKGEKQQLKLYRRSNISVDRLLLNLSSNVLPCLLTRIGLLYFTLEF